MCSSEMLLTVLNDSVKPSAKGAEQLIGWQSGLTVRDLSVTRDHSNTENVRGSHAMIMILYVSKRWTGTG